MSSKFYLVAGVILLLNMTLAGCKPSSPPTQITLQLNWIHEAEFAGYYVAEAQGFYKDENLAVTIKPGGIGINARKLLLAGEADFSVLGFGEHRRNIEKGEPATAVMATFQISPLVLFALSDAGIQKPQDMIGRRVAVKDENWRKVISDTLRRANVDPAAIVAVDVKPEEMEKLYNRQVDVWTGFVHNELTEAQMAGYKVNLIFPSDYGIGGYEGMIVVRQDTLDQNPDLVARFVRASLRGWQYVAEHPNETAQIVAKWHPEKSLEFHRLAVQVLAPLIDTGKVPIGWIDAQRWQATLGKTYQPDRPGYTMQFVEPQQK